MANCGSVHCGIRNAACGAGGWVLKVIVADPTLEFAAIENDLGEPP